MVAVARTHPTSTLRVFDQPNIAPGTLGAGSSGPPFGARTAIIARDLLLPKRARDLVGKGFDQIREHLAITSRDKHFDRHPRHKRDVSETADLFGGQDNPHRKPGSYRSDAPEI